MISHPVLIRLPSLYSFSQRGSSWAQTLWSTDGRAGDPEFMCSLTAAQLPSKHCGELGRERDKCEKKKKKKPSVGYIATEPYLDDGVGCKAAGARGVQWDALPPLWPSSRHLFLLKLLHNLFLRLPLLHPHLLYSVFLFKQKPLGPERQQIKLMGLMQTLSSAIQNNRSWSPRMFQHEDIRTGSDRGHCWCLAESYTLNTKIPH